jgi:tRNA modification GTPase
MAIRQLIEPEVLIAAATKSDFLEENVLAERLCMLNRLFDTDFLATSAKTGKGLALLRETIDRKIIELAVGGAKPKARYEIRDTKYEIALTSRHRQAVVEAIESVGESINEVRAGNDEVGAMMLRAAYQAISNIGQHSVDEEILERIFSRFCIGK